MQFSIAIFVVIFTIEPFWQPECIKLRSEMNPAGSERVEIWIMTGDAKLLSPQLNGTGAKEGLNNSAAGLASLDYFSQSNYNAGRF
jgi:hypothetical protein